MSKFTNDLLNGPADGAKMKEFLIGIVDDFNMLKNPHRRPDVTNVDATAAATNAATCYALANSLKAKYNAHVALTSSHFVADATNTITSNDANSVATLLTLGNEIKADFNAHLANTGHVATDDVNTIVAADIAGADDAAKTAAAVILLNEAKAKYNAHLAYAWGALKTSK